MKTRKPNEEIAFVGDSKKISQESSERGFDVKMGFRQQPLYDNLEPWSR